jgi:serralysin
VAIEEQGGLNGIDTVNAAVSYTLGAFVNNLTLTGGAAINGTGNEIDNVLRGNAAANVLSGLAGNDTLDGGAGIYNTSNQSGDYGDRPRRDLVAGQRHGPPD